MRTLLSMHQKIICDLQQRQAALCKNLNLSAKRRKKYQGNEGPCSDASSCSLRSNKLRREAYERESTCPGARGSNLIGRNMKAIGILGLPN